MRSAAIGSIANRSSENGSSQKCRPQRDPVLAVLDLELIVELRLGPAALRGKAANVEQRSGLEQRERALEAPSDDAADRLPLASEDEARRAALIKRCFP